MWDNIAKQISIATGRPFKLIKATHISGGCINNAVALQGEDLTFFVKLNGANLIHMFEAEAKALIEIAKTKSVLVPTPICHGVSEKQSYLVLEFLNMTNKKSEKCHATLGTQLAKLHRVTNDQFGWVIDNTIGETPQLNTATKSWIEFYRNQRLAYQFQRTKETHHHSFKHQVKLLDNLELFFKSYTPIPSLLHGDLWSGNYSCITGSNIPIIYDPATYYGDRETDIAFSEWFGGFSNTFYDTYNEAYPLDAGYKKRKNLYNLYHMLNHYNLFGGGYAQQAQDLIDSLISKIEMA